MKFPTRRHALTTLVISAMTLLSVIRGSAGELSVNFDDSSGSDSTSGMNQERDWNESSSLPVSSTRTLKLADYEPQAGIRVNAGPQLNEVPPVDLPALTLPVDESDIQPMSDPEVARALATRPAVSMNHLPYSAVGRLVARFRDPATGREFESSGTAWVVGKRGLITAGHCLYYQRAEAISATFLPNHTSEAAPLSFPVTEIAWHPRWRGDNSTLAWDFGACITRSDVSSVTGILGYQARGRLPDEVIHSIGYPARRRAGLPFDGKVMWQSDGMGFKRGAFHATGCDLTQGASGGPWVVETPFGLKVVGHNSWINTSEPGVMHSPVYNDNCLVMVRWLDDRSAFR